MELIEQLFELFFKAVETGARLTFDFFEMLMSGIPIKNKEYSATFISQGELLSSRQHGFCLTGRRNLSIKNSYQNALVIGGTGTGKSSIVLVPSLYTMQSSFIVH